MSRLAVLRHDSPTYHTDLQVRRAQLQRGGLTAASESSGLDVARTVRELIEQVQKGGDPAIAELTSRFDRANLSVGDLRVSERELAEAHAATEPSFLELVRSVAANIREYQRHILVKAPEPLVRGGRVLGIRYTPMDRVGVYVPGGRALYPSTVLMTVVPAQVAGVPEIVMASPPTGGNIHPLALALAAELGIKEVYRMGGAVAVAALACGTPTIRSVQKIVGPGNAFVAEAKRQLFGRVGIDSIAGPSEVFIVADDSADPSHVAADLLAQAEHDPGSAILASPDLKLVEGVLSELERQLPRLDRRDAIVAALAEYSALVWTRDLDEACELANQFATEHLQIMTRDDSACLAKIRHAGAIFVGGNTPVPLGDYCAGPSHVLPTGGTARFFGALSANDFQKASSLISYDRAALIQDGPSVVTFAKHEGLTAHAAAVTTRLGPGSV